jgi:hypothetical protein
MGLNGGSKCMKCIGGGGVWCSRTYAYVSSTSAYQGTFVAITSTFTDNNVGMALFPNGKNASATTPTTTDAMMVGGPGLDGGSCCAVTRNKMAVEAGYIGTAALIPTDYN